MRIVLAQLNLLVGDITSNLAKIKAAALTANNSLHADLIIFPELALVGYPPEDLLLRPELYQRVAKAINELTHFLPELYVLIGYPEEHKQQYYNAAALLHGGKIVAKYYKQFLPNYGVFDEKRYFEVSNEPCIANVKGHKVAITICEDLWHKKPARQAKQLGAELLLSLNASPFDLNKPLLREEVMALRAREAGMPLVYVNCVGGQDELVFDGGSLVLNKEGEVTERGEFFKECLIPVNFSVQHGALQPKSAKVLPILSKEERAYQALVLGVRDYVAKNHFPGALIGLSGGIDSALVLAIAVDALGKDRVQTVFMPSRYTRSISGEDASLLASNFGVRHIEISIEPVFKAFLASLSLEFKNLSPDTTEENLQARCRGTLLMALSNKKKYIVLSTGNKSEMAVGYSTLYGDMVGGFCVLKDVPKTLVYELANYRNSVANYALIPQRIITRAPSAELKSDQEDTDSLPPYDVLDAILERFVERDECFAKIVAAGFNPETVKRIIDLVYHNEYKRRQAPVGVRITERAFGRDRRYPITSGF